MDTLIDGTVPSDDGLRELHTSIVDGASYHKPDHYYLLLDYVSYLVTKKRAISDWRDREAFGRKCLMNIASAGKFSADRSVKEYAENIWKV